MQPIQKVLAQKLINQTYKLNNANKVILDKGLCLGNIDSNGFEGVMEAYNVYNKSWQEKAQIMQDCIKNYNIIRVSPPKTILEYCAKEKIAPNMAILTPKNKHFMTYKMIMN